MICLEYAWYIPRVCSPPSYAWYIHGISLDIPCISIRLRLDTSIHGISESLDILGSWYTMYIHQAWVYTLYIHGYTWYIIGCIYMICTWYIEVYPWIFLAFWNQISPRRPARAAAGLIQCAHACWWPRVFYYTRHHGNCARGKGCPQKAQPNCHQRSPPVAGGGGDGSGGGGVAGVFPFS